MKDQSVEVVGHIGQGEFRLCAGQTDCLDKQAKAVLLMGKDMLDSGAVRRLLRIGPGSCQGYRVTCGFASVDTAGEQTSGQPLLVALRTVTVHFFGIILPIWRTMLF